MLSKSVQEVFFSGPFAFDLRKIILNTEKYFLMEPLL